MADAGSLRKGDAIVGRTEDSCGDFLLRMGDAIVGRMVDGCGDVLMRMGDAGSGRMGDESESFSRDSRMDDESFVEVEDDFLWRCSGVDDIPCA